MGLTPVLVGFVAVVIGGFGRMFGAVIGGLLLGALSSLLPVYLPDGLVPFRDAIVFTFPVLILIPGRTACSAAKIGKAGVFEPVAPPHASIGRCIVAGAAGP